MKQFGEGSLRKLAMDAPTESIFHFEGEDYKEKRKVEIFIAMSNQGFFFYPFRFFYFRDVYAFVYVFGLSPSSMITKYYAWRLCMVQGFTLPSLGLPPALLLHFPTNC